MLVELSVANFRSLRDQQTFSLIKGKGSELQETNSFKANSMELLRSAAIYGPNAGGKSNFLLALQAMKRVVLESATSMQRGDQLPVMPFRLDPGTRLQPSEFEVIFIVDGVRYQYGFAATAERIHEEWLLAYPKHRAQRWFARVWNAKGEQYHWEFGSHLTGEKLLWQKSTRDNALFLSTAVQLNSHQLQPVFDWFRSRLRLSGVGGWSPDSSALLCEQATKSRILDFLRAADLDIEDVLVEKTSLDVKALPESMPESLRETIAEDFTGKQLLKIQTVRTGSDGLPVRFDLAEESDGTRKVFAFAGPWLEALKHGHVLFIDELHDNLHPELVKFLVQLFHHEETNPHHAQLIFTTHETSILNQAMFRRDQIWFCDKDKGQATVLYPLTDFSPRKGRENLELAYLSGRYGALPYVRSLTREG